MWRWYGCCVGCMPYRVQVSVCVCVGGGGGGGAKGLLGYKCVFMVVALSRYCLVGAVITA